MMPLTLLRPGEYSTIKKIGGKEEDAPASLQGEERKNVPISSDG